jgi:hypothetical protein
MLMRFVDSITANPTVRLDLHDQDVWWVAPGTRLDPPPPKRARVSTLLADGAHYPATAYDDRLIQLRLVLQGLTDNAAATQIQRLARELDRDGNILQYQPRAVTHPVFFRTQRLGLSALNAFRVETGYRIEADIPAEPFAFGVEQDLGTFTIANDPAAAVANPTRVDIAGVLGDVEAPTLVKKQVAGAGGLVGLAVNLFTLRRRGDPSGVPYLLQAEAMTQGTDTTTQANDAAFSGGSNNWSRCTFGTATLATRLSLMQWPASPSVDARGTYRVFARVRKTVGTDTIRVQLRAGGPESGGVAAVTLPTVTLPFTTTLHLIDLGLVQIPVGVHARSRGPSGVEMAAEGTRVELWASRPAGTGSLDVDYLLWVPADDTLALTELTETWNASGDSGVVFDSSLDGLYAHRDTGDVVVNNGVGRVSGRLPMLSPGVTNRLYILEGVGPTVANDVAVSQDWQISYWPRYLHVRPPST